MSSDDSTHGSISEHGVLAGLRVAEFAQNAAVPQCGRLFAGMGADVVKIEPPTGDAMRHLTAIMPNESRAYATINPGKRTMSLDLGADGSRPVVDRLLQWADIVLVGLKATDIERYGLNWERVRQVNPGVVSLEFTAFGPKGPDADAGGYDQLVQAASGVGFSMNRAKDGVPLPTRPAFIDFGSGGVAAAAVLAALRHRDRTGNGQRVDASLLGTALSLGTPILSSFDVDKERVQSIREEMDALRLAQMSFAEQRAHYESRVLAGGGVFRLYVRPYATSDGLVSIAGYSPGLMERFHALTGLPTLPPGAGINEPEFVAVVDQAEALFATRTTEEWIQDLSGVGYPCSRYNTPYEAIETPQVEANDYVVDLEHEAIGGYRTIGMPFSFSDTPVGVTTPAPLLGSGTVEVLGELGYSAEEVEALLADGIAAGPPAT